MRFRSFVVLAALLPSTACTRVAQVPPAEIPKLSGRPAQTVSVELTDGGHVLIRPNFRSVRVLYRGKASRIDNLYRAPLFAEIRGDSLVIGNSTRTRLVAYPLDRIERTEITQPDASGTEVVGGVVLVGAVVGAFIGGAAGEDCPEHPSGYLDLCFGRAGSAMVGTFAGAGIGSLIGLVFIAHNRYYSKDGE